MQAIILAAGMGRRLKHLTQDNTKCMLEVGGMRLIDRIFDSLTTHVISRVIIVVGYEAQNLIEYVNSQNYEYNIEFINNKDYSTTNNIYSLALAADYMRTDDTLLFESDLIFENKIVDKILKDSRPNLAVVDKYESWMDGTVVKIEKDGTIRTFISKKYFDYKEKEQYYKTVNIYKFSKEFAKEQYLPMLNAYISVFGDNEYYEQVLRVLTMLEKTDLKALPLSGEKWYEIDDIQDYDIATSLFTPNDDEQWKAYTFRYGGYWRYPSLLDFCYLVNPYFPNENLINEMKSNFETLLREYPSGMGVNSLLAAKYFDIEPKYTAVGNGAAELIKIYIENYVGTLGLTFPTFEEYPNRLPEERVVRYVPTNSDFAYTASDLKAYFSDKSINTLLLINPDNPSGNYIPYSEMISLVEWAAERGIQLIVDESFVDFVDVEGEFSLLKNEILEKYPHLVVIKSISKSYGVPGLRLGVLATGNTENIARIKKEVSIWNINSFAEFYMQIFGKYEKDYKNACQLFIEERKLFFEELRTISYLRVIPSQANYFMCEVLDKMSSRGLAIKLLKEHDILIKDCSGKDAFDGKQYIRLAIRDRNDNRILVEKLKGI